MPLELAVALRQSRLQELRSALAETLDGHRELTLELGCGHGHYLSAYAAAHPTECCLGLDLLADRIERARRKTERARLTNVHWFQADAALALEAMPESIRLAKIIILFPDPWPKRRHWKNRLIQPTFLTLLASRATPTAHLYFRTDHHPYFLQAAQIFTEHPHWQPNPHIAWPFELTTVFQARAARFDSLVAVVR